MIVSYLYNTRLYKTCLVTKITFLYKSIYHSLSVQGYLPPDFKTRLGLDILNSECVWLSMVGVEHFQCCL